MTNFLLVAAGGLLGSLARYLIAYIYPTTTNWNIFLINMLGCFIMGMLSACENKLTPNHKLFLFIGFLGAFTTFSSFIAENMNFINTHRFVLAFCNILGTNVGGFFAYIVGSYIVKTFSR